MSVAHKDATPVDAASLPAPSPLGGSGAGSVVDLSIPRVGVWHDDDHRYFMDGNGPIPSVTTVLDVLDKPDLTRYFKARIAQLTIDMHRDGRYQALVNDGKTDAQIVSAILATPDDKKNRAAVVGTGVHLFADRVARAPDAPYGFEIPDEYQPYLDAFSRFLGRYSASSIVSSEHAVLGAGYAGTFDLLMTIKGELWLLDIKTGSVHEDMALQLAGYANAECIVLPNDPKRYTFPKPQRCGILHLRPDDYRDEGYRIIEFDVTHDDYVAFLAALELWHWRKGGTRIRQRFT